VWSAPARLHESRTIVLDCQAYGCAKPDALRERRPQLDAIRDRTDGEVKSVLDADEYTRYVELREKFRAEIRERIREG